MIIDELKGAVYGLIICTLITMCSGCKTKKAITSIAHKQTYDSVAVVKETTHTTFSIIDTTRTSEHSKTITEYTFCSVESGGGSFAHLTNEASRTPFVPMVVRKADGTLQINYGLAGIKQTTEQSKNEKKGITQSKDSTTHKDNKTKVSATEQDKHKDKNIQRTQVTEPFDWWQLVFALSFVLVIIYLLLYIKDKKISFRQLFRRLIK
ncbi:hypothetical protein [Prevotella disiens]|uniref:Uncharacterized protein n=1 Tax=Prevotella disiens DNF00882 TaxID=1401075 RepID=A0A096CU06_9BACT|nr:hypothetical protein [Prevotella disiens]KGF48759.1 hypothetical protein HMPREF0654_07825 [Prevotella disiens DNF00882]